MDGYLNKILQELRDELLRQIDVKSLQTATFKVATTAPFTVYLSGSSVAVPALKVDGATYSVNDTGLAILTELAPPVCLKTV